MRRRSSHVRLRNPSPFGSVILKVLFSDVSHNAQNSVIVLVSGSAIGQRSEIIALCLESGFEVGKELFPANAVDETSRDAFAVPSDASVY